MEAGGRIRCSRVIELLARLIAPPHLRSDNSPQFVARAPLKGIVGQGIGTALIDPGKPWQNGVGESFDGKFRDACPSPEWFRAGRGEGGDRELAPALQCSATAFQSRLSAPRGTRGEVPTENR